MLGELKCRKSIPLMMNLRFRSICHVFHSVHMGRGHYL